MADQAHESIHVHASADRLWEIAVDFERYPEWAKDVKSVEVKSRDDQGRAKTVEFRAAAMGRSMTYTLEYDYTDGPSEFSWHLVAGDIVKQLDGTYRFDPLDDGTEVHYWLTIDVAIPVPGLVKRRAAGMILGTALKELKKEAEPRG